MDSMDSKEARSVLSDFLHLKLDKVGRKANSVANPIYEINKRNRAANPGGVDLIPDDSVSRRISNDEARVLKYIQYASRWVPANPSNDKTIKKINSTYVGVSETFIESNTKMASPNIANLITDTGFAFDGAIKQAKYILLSGVRGVGKTAFMNYWLTQNTRTLEDSMITWFRIDATKVYGIWRENRGYKVEDLFEKYYLIHALYVILRYSGELHTTSRTAFKEVKTNIFFKSLIDRVRVQSPEALENCKNFFIDAKNQAPVRLDESVDIVSRVVSMKHQNTKTNLEKLKSAIAHDFEIHGISTISIIDGIDNIAWTKRNTFYQKTCVQFSVITDVVINMFGPNNKMILAVRPETIHEIRYIATSEISPSGFNWQYNHDQLLEWRIIPPPAREVLAKKLNAASDPDVFADERLEAATDQQERDFLNDILDEIQRDTHIYPEAIENNTRDALKHLLSARVKPSLQWLEGSLSQQNLLKFVFDNDLRAFLDNVIKVFFIRRSLLQKHNMPLSEFQRRVMQFVLLNGRPFFNSREQYLGLEGKKSRANFRDRGMVFPNLFWWPIEATSPALNNWHGLAALRLLQLAECKGAFTCGDLIYCTKIILGYDTEVLVEIMESLVAFGLIDIHTETAASEIDYQRLSHHRLHDYNNRGYLTEKGKIFPALVMARPDLLYFYALDTPQKFDLVVEDTRLIKSFFEFSSGTVQDQFYSAAIPTVATFLLHVFHFAALENSKIRSNKAKAKAEHKLCLEYFGGQNAVADAMALPSNLMNTFLDWAERGMTPSHYRDKNDTDNIVRNVIGVFRGYTQK